MSYVNCKHWSPKTVESHGLCAIGKQDGEPTIWYCVKMCPDQEPKKGERKEKSFSLPVYEDVAQKVAAVRPICEACPKRIRTKTGGFWHGTGIDFQSHVLCMACHCASKMVHLTLGVCPLQKWVKGVPL